MIDRDSSLAQSYLWRRQQNLRWPAALAFAGARADTQRRYAHGTDHKYGGNWQTLDSMPRFASKTDRAYYCDEFPFRVVGRADGVARKNDRYRSIDHTGWYTDDDGTIAGYVLLLPHGRYLPATRHSEWDGVTLYPLDSYDDEMECARAADGYAEKAAEEERDYQRAWRAGSDASMFEEEAVSARRKILQICGDLREARRRVTGKSDAIERLCGMARDKVQSLLSDITEAREKRDELRDNYGSESAFQEGYSG